MLFSIRLVDSNGHAESGVPVVADYGWWNGQDTELTDSDGWAAFERAGAYASCTIFIDGKNYGVITLKDEATFSFIRK